MPQRGFHCIVDLEDVSFEECVGCASTLGRCQFTASILRGMADQSRAREAGDPLLLPVVASAPSPATLQAPSFPHPNPLPVGEGVPDDGPIPKLGVTALVGCLRQTYLKATEDYYQRPDQQYWAYRGTLAHLLAERGAGEDVVSERRFDRDLVLPNGRTVTITGQPDEIDPARKLMIDYKTADRVPRTLSAHHIAQLNVYRWLVTPHHAIERLGLVYLTMRETKKVAAPIWPEGQVERYLAERAGPLAEAYATGSWPTMTEDTWMCRYCPVAATCEIGERSDDGLTGDAIGGVAGEPAARPYSATVTPSE